MLVDERRVDDVDAAEPLHEDLVRTVDHDLGDVGVAQQRLDRAVAEDLVEQFGGDPRRIGDRERRLVARQYLVDRVADLLFEDRVPGAVVVQLRSEDVEQLAVYPQAQRGDRAAAGARRVSRDADAAAPGVAAFRVPLGQPVGEAHRPDSLRSPAR